MCNNISVEMDHIGIAKALNTQVLKDCFRNNCNKDQLLTFLWTHKIIYPDFGLAVDKIGGKIFQKGNSYKDWVRYLHIKG